ncbi:MAG TPA: FtsX-like permease family protein [Candidatus Limnocylindria bacterium]|nr:FtsX-like permease family protein [Candidatus Limnocylindria bacterium]
MRLPLWIAGRYLRTRRRSGFITLLTGISIGGVALGVTALLTVLAVMNGFENEIQTRIAGTDAHVVLLGETTAGITDAASLASRAAQHPGVAGVAPFTYAKAMVLRRGLAEGLVVKGVDLAAERNVTTIAENIHSPALDSIPAVTARGLPGIVLGSELAARLEAAPGDTVLLASLAGAERGAFGVTPKIRPFEVVGLFSSGLYTYDSSFGFTSIAASQRFFDLGDAVTGLEVKVEDRYAAPRIAAELLRAAGMPGLRANNWIELNRNLFTWMKLEKTVMFVILALIVLVAAFNIVSTLFMVVLEKRRDIGVLKSLGASRATVLQVFLWEGLLIGGLGTGFGVAFGWLLIGVLQRYPFVRLPGDVYFIERLPVRPEAGDFAAVILAALLLCLAAALYPAWRASLLEPVDAIRRQA